MPMMDSQRISRLMPAMTQALLSLRILILGGTGEARALGDAVAARPEFSAIISLAGRTREPLAQPLPTRIGGFGGMEGLNRFIRDNTIDAVIDATHPFAAQISANAVAACGRNTPLIRLERPAWHLQAGDVWHGVSTSTEAAALLEQGEGCVFLAMGRLELEPFRRMSRPALVRTVDQLEASLLAANWIAIEGIGPFAFEDEIALFAKHKVTAIVTKNSGGDATRAKLDAARVLGLPVVMIKRPTLPKAKTATSISGILQWLDLLHRGSTPTERAV
jgi:precorrin-6A/cobalt-precorrin-6A reductase